MKKSVKKRILNLISGVKTDGLIKCILPHTFSPLFFVVVNIFIAQINKESFYKLQSEEEEKLQKEKKRNFLP